MNHTKRYTVMHWGLYQAHPSPDGLRLAPHAGDPDPSRIGGDLLEANRSSLRIRHPAARESWLLSMRTGVRSQDTRHRGAERFVPLEWDEALDLASREIQRIRDQHGNRSIFGGSYGWASAVRFHHAQSQIHRFLNAIGGYVRHTDSYSLGAGRALLPHILMTMDEFMASHDDWSTLAENTRLVVAFGGIPAKNAQVTPGGAQRHGLRTGLAAMARAGCRFINISPVADNLDAPPEQVEWIPIRPNTDVTVMMAIAHTLIDAELHDEAFLNTHCTGYSQWRDELFGRHDGVVKDAAWAAALSGVPAARIRALAHELVSCRSLINCAWALQRAEHGEQPFWGTVALAAVVGQIGLPGGGFALGYGPLNLMGSAHPRVPGPSLPQGSNPISAFIPVARLVDKLEHPGEPFDYNGGRHAYPDIRLIYWAGGNPFHHHQDLNRLVRAWQRPETVIVHEAYCNAHAKMADLVLPATTALEREDIGFASREPYLVWMSRLTDPPGDARDDFAIFSALARRLGVLEAYTEGRDAEQWLHHLYESAAQAASARGTQWPPFDTFREQGLLKLDGPANAAPTRLAAFRANPVDHPLPTPSGRIELHSAAIARLGFSECPGHPAWRPPSEWLGAPNADRYPLHLISDQPDTRLHSQLDHAPASQATKIDGKEPVYLNPEDAAERDIRDGDIIRIFNDRGACLAGARVDPMVMRGVIRLSTGSWYSPQRPGDHDPVNLELSGNPNVLTQDVGSSRLGQGCSAMSCLVEVRRDTVSASPTTGTPYPSASL
ncbi:MAG: molybdopterin-dependent oxidoreductase [Azoarcus sp.]|nr:molybdopterin-dependent oxidoreductase [Azoarcus sp.]